MEQSCRTGNQDEKDEKGDVEEEQDRRSMNQDKKEEKQKNKDKENRGRDVRRGQE